MDYLHSLTLVFHSVVRYFVLIAMILSILRSARGWFGGAPFDKLDEKLSLWLLMMAHTQLILGLILYGVSPAVVFSGASMKDPVARYWLVEHITTMLIAITLITLSRITTKRLTSATSRASVAGTSGVSGAGTGSSEDSLRISVAKHKRVFLYNVFAMVLILMAISMSGRGFFNLPSVL